MPELPEVEHLRLSLVPRLVGRGVTSVSVRRRDVVAVPGGPAGGFARARGSAARPRRLDPRVLLTGGAVRELRRLGKQLAIIADDGRIVCIHLGMSGQLRWSAPGSSRRAGTHEHVTWSLDDGSRLAFRDPRRFGGVWTFPTFADLQAARWSALGPDALSITPAGLKDALGRTGRPLKAALLDQSVIAGVGNIYADEALFLAGLSPTRPASGLAPQQASALAEAIRKVMHASIASGGSTLRDYLDADGIRGRNQFSFQVYGKGGRPCPACGRGLRALRVAQRATVMCPACQR